MILLELCELLLKAARVIRDQQAKLQLLDEELAEAAVVLEEIDGAVG